MSETNADVASVQDDINRITGTYADIDHIAKEAQLERDELARRVVTGLLQLEDLQVTFLGAIEIANSMRSAIDTAGRTSVEVSYWLNGTLDGATGEHAIAARASAGKIVDVLKNDGTDTIKPALEVLSMGIADLTKGIRLMVDGLNNMSEGLDGIQLGLTEVAGKDGVPGHARFVVGSLAAYQQEQLHTE